MSTADSAASLFGDTDDSSDFFSTSQPDDASELYHTQSPEHQAVYDIPASLLEHQETQYDLPHGELERPRDAYASGAPYEQYNMQQETYVPQSSNYSNAQQTYHNGSHLAYNEQHPQSYTPLTTSSQTQQSWYSPQPQQSDYVNPSAHTYASSEYHAPAQTYTAASSSYDPYSPGLTPAPSRSLNSLASQPAPTRSTTLQSLDSYRSSNKSAYDPPVLSKRQPHQKSSRVAHYDNLNTFQPQLTSTSSSHFPPTSDSLHTHQNDSVSMQPYDVSHHHQSISAQEQYSAPTMHSSNQQYPLDNDSNFFDMQAPENSSQRGGGVYNQHASNSEGWMYDATPSSEKAVELLNPPDFDGVYAGNALDAEQSNAGSDREHHPESLPSPAHQTLKTYNDQQSTGGHGDFMSGNTSLESQFQPLEQLSTVINSSRVDSNTGGGTETGEPYFMDNDIDKTPSQPQERYPSPPNLGSGHPSQNYGYEPAYGLNIRNQALPGDALPTTLGLMALPGSSVSRDMKTEASHADAYHPYAASSHPSDPTGPSGDISSFQPYPSGPAHGGIDGLPQSSSGSAAYLIDPYAPASLPSARGSAATSDLPSQYAPTSRSPDSHESAPVHSLMAPQTTYLPPISETISQSVATHIHQQYAPSPSLLGLNDPLERVAARAPVFSFAFGGKVVSCFHLAQSAGGGFDVAMSSHEGKSISVRVLHELVSASTLEPATSFPGPLFGDTGGVSIGLMGAGASGNTKSKKAQVLTYLNERADEEERGVGHLATGTVERLRSESQVILLRLLHQMVQDDGSLNRSPQSMESVRQLLTGGSGVESSYNNNAAPYNEQPLSNSPLKRSDLNKLQDMLLSGDRRQAYRYAVEQRLWGHALLIANGLDKDSWNEVVAAFIRSEIPQESSLGITSPTAQSGTFEALKVAYALYGGLGASALQQMSMFDAPTPLSPSYGKHSLGKSFESISMWSKVAAMAFNNQAAGNSALLTSLGDQLADNNLIHAAHVCYLLSPNTSTLGAAGHGQSKAVLLGSPDPLQFTAFHKDADPFVLTEIAEFALSLSMPAKGKDVFGGLSHLQPYRLVRASQLADLGHTVFASKYCDAINASLKLNTKPLSQTNLTFREQLRELSERLTGSPQSEKGRSWMIGKMPTAKMGSLSGWVEGFIAGDSGNSGEAQSVGIPTQDPSTYGGAFAGYSNISSANTSQSPSPSPSVQHQISSNQQLPYPPPRPPSVPHYGVNRAASAMDYLRPPRGTSPVLRNASATGFTNAYSPHPQFLASSSDSHREIPAKHTDGYIDGANQQSYDPPSQSWWGGQEDPTGLTPVAATFSPGNAGISPDNPGDNPVSLVDSGAGERFAATHDKMPDATASDDELGLGNSKRKSVYSTPKADDKGSEDKSDKNTTPTATERPVAKQASSSSSWLGWMWKRPETPTSGPIRAKLGEESSFYYDKEQKRWINKKGGSDSAATPPPPPPPARQATAPPGSAPAHSGSFQALNTLKGTAPPDRPASVGETPSQTSNKPPPPRARSNLIPTDVNNPALIPPSPPSRLSAATPPSRPRSSVSKKGLKSRYVDVLQQGT